MKIIVDNLATEYLDEGTGPVILMLHGWWRDHSDFDKISEILKNHFRIIRLDLPGFRGTEMPQAVWKVADYAIFVQRFLDKLQVKPKFVLGHSFGGRIIIKNHFGAEKIILISAAGLKTGGFRKKIFMIFAKIGDLATLIPPLIFARKKLKTKFYQLIGSDYLDSGEMKEIFKAVVEENLSLFANNIQTPTLLIWGESDFVTPLDQARTLSKLIKNSELKIIKDAGHLSFLEKPNEIAEIIKEFLK